MYSTQCKLLTLEKQRVSREEYINIVSLRTGNRNCVIQIHRKLDNQNAEGKRQRRETTQENNVA